MRAAEAIGRITIRTFHEVASVHGENGHLSSAVLRDIKSKAESSIDVDAIIPLLGFVSDLGPMREWGLDLAEHEIKVRPTMDTGRPGIYAAGDVTAYPGKLKLATLTELS